MKDKLIRLLGGYTQQDYIDKRENSFQAGYSCFGRELRKHDINKYKKMRGIKKEINEDIHELIMWIVKLKNILKTLKEASEMECKHEINYSGDMIEELEQLLQKHKAKENG